MDRGSDKHNPMVDDVLKHETEGLVRGGHSTHAEEWKEAEPSGEGQPSVDLAPDATLVGGTPEGMTPDDVEGRAELASYLGKEVYPAVRQRLVDVLVERNAPDRVVSLLSELPDGHEFANVNEVWEAVGGGAERHRF